MDQARGIPNPTQHTLFPTQHTSHDTTNTFCKHCCQGDGNTKKQCTRGGGGGLNMTERSKWGLEITSGRPRRALGGWVFVVQSPHSEPCQACQRAPPRMSQRLAPKRAPRVYQHDQPAHDSAPLLPSRGSSVYGVSMATEHCWGGGERKSTRLAAPGFLE